MCLMYDEHLEIGGSNFIICSFFSKIYQLEYVIGDSV